MKKLHYMLICINIVHGKLSHDAKKEFCENLKCDENEDAPVCGMRYEENGIRLRLFDNECQLMKFGCKVDKNQTFGLISMEHCISTENEKSIKLLCPDCSDIPRDPVCGIHPDGEGFRVRTFNNECDLKKYNCEVKENFTITDYFICSNNPNAEANETNNNKEKFQNMFKKHKDSANEPTKDDKLPTMIEENNTNKFKNIVVLHGPSSLAENINKTFADFFALTHTYDIPLQSLNLSFNDTTRRKIIRNLGPVKVFKPQFTKPKIVKEDWWHLPTLQTCYHKCPTKCPDYYKPICGVNAIWTKWPAIVFQNHCFMDAAQCKIYWDDPEYGEETTGYIEVGFMACLGDRTVFTQFLPFVKTLQYMGRLSKSRTYRQVVRNMKHFGMNKVMG